jgi:myo-inositol 2-dehydrogenase / D-chiro-inositol 1-dehydrogenase
MSELRVAIVGCGRMGRERATAATQLGARVVEVCDTNSEMARDLAATLPECRALQNVWSLSWHALDAVFVCTPPYTRGPVECAAIARDVPVFMEKPVGLSVAQCLPIQAALQVHPVLTAVGYMNRYRESVQRARQAIAKKTILGVACHWVGGVYRVPWWREKKLSGGPLNEQATHLVDLARYLVGEITEVHGLMSPAEAPTEQVHTAGLHLRFAAGPLCAMLYSCMSDTKMISFQVFTPETKVQLEGWNFQLVEDGTNEPMPLPDLRREAIFQQEVAAFLADVATHSRQNILCDFEDAMKTQGVVDALQRSIETGLTCSVRG